SDDHAVKQVTALTLAELFSDAAPPGPELAIELLDRPRRLQVTLRPRRYSGITLDEVSFEAALGSG
ncbi:MAG TPA: hypothetical protein VGI10_14455, partial [Polyangiaceae bacterium]